MKRLFITIYVLTLADTACTIAGIKAGCISEGNPLIEMAMNEFPIMTGILICLFTGCILIGLYLLQKQVRWLIYGISGLLIIKIAVIVMHLNWIVQAVQK